MKEEIEIIHPKPYARVGAEFILSGRIPKSWLKTSWGGMDYRVLGGFLDINGFEFASTVTACVQHNLFSVFKKKLYFSTAAQFSQFNAPFIAKSQGRIALKLSGQKEGCDYFLPLIVDGFEPKNGVDPEIDEKHKNIGKKVLQYEVDLKNYGKELAGIRKGIVYEKKILEGIFEILDKPESSFDAFSESEEDEQEKALEEKYRDTIEWRGPLLGGIAGRMEGFEFRVYSGDHNPKHFHIIHKGHGIDARFSFPQIELINYKGRSNTIGSKESERIREFFGATVNFQKLDGEFQKQLS
ncbi:MAG: hypothetical protein Q8P01_05210 [bacterium]|nr:hypothetical protein [bacterium]